LVPRYQSDPLKVHDIQPGFPAEKAGLKSGDLLETINGQTLHSVPAVMAFLQQQNGQPVTVNVLRDGKPVTLQIKPVWADNGAGQMGYRLGFTAYLPPFHVEQLPFPAAVNRSVSFNLHNSGYILDVLHRLVTRRSNVQQLSGPIGIARDTGEAITMPGWQPIITLMALISLNLGIFNLLPIPILDGGMILLLLIEGTIRRDLNQQFKERIYQVAFVVLVLFAVFVMFNDVSKFNIFSKLKP
jgi:regulator of sigma E protease